MNLNFQTAGYFRIVKRDNDSGKITHDTGFFRNVITNTGLDAIGWRRPTTACVVGIGTTPELPTDVTLAQQVAISTQSGGATTYPYSTSPPYYTAMRSIYRFAAGAAAGNLTEVGVTVSDNNLWSRSLIKDSSGNPVTITVLPNEILDVTYEIRMFLMDDDLTGSVNVAGVNHSYTMRGASIGTKQFSGFLFGGIGAASYSASAYTGGIGPATGIPSGTGATSSNSASWQAYVDGNFYRDFTCNFGVNDGNVAGGLIKSMRIVAPIIGDSSAPEFQMEFTPALTKNNTITLGVRFRISWSRMP